MKGNVFEIKRFAVHDGDGIRTTVFFKGCPLRCLWCHNPEGLTQKKQLAFYEHKCVGCAECVKVCPSGAHRLSEGAHVFEREKCTACGKCAEVCVHGALTLFGKEVEVADLMPTLLEDREFYAASGGGVTLSGGECLMQADFCAELLKELKANGISTAVDTCGAVPKAELDKVVPYTDVFLYDLKAYDDGVHRNCTGRTNRQILENLVYLDSIGKDIEIRIPFVPDHNSDQIEKLSRFIATLSHVKKIRLLPYHNYAGSKYSALGMKNTLPITLPTNEQLEVAQQWLEDC